MFLPCNTFHSVQKMFHPDFIPATHEAAEVVTKRKYNGEILLKPIVVHHYNNCMNFVDKTDHLLSPYIALKGNKWYRKLVFTYF